MEIGGCGFEKPRLRERGVNGEREVAIPAHEAMQSDDTLSQDDDKRRPHQELRGDASGGLQVCGLSEVDRDAVLGIKRMRELAKSLSKQYPDVATSPRDGLEETFTINHPELSPSLRRILGTTNIKESAFGGVRRRTGRVT